MEINEMVILTDYQKSRALIAKMIHMIERDEPNMKVMEKNISTIGYLNVIHKNLMENYVSLCFNKGVDTKNEKKKAKMTKEILKALRLYNK